MHIHQRQRSILDPLHFTFLPSPPTTAPPWPACSCSKLSLSYSPMLLLKVSSITLIATELMVGHALVRSFPRRHYAGASINNCINTYLLARHHSTFPTPTHKLCRHQPTIIRDDFSCPRRYYAHTPTCLSGMKDDDTLDTTSTIGNDSTQINKNEDDARQNRKERLHYHLSEMGVDSGLLADAAFRSVTTTGK